MEVGLQHPVRRIDVWLTFHDEIHDQALLANFSSLLSKEEARRNAAFHFERDRKCDLVTRALVRTVLSRYVSVEPRDWEFSTNRYGKPRIVNTAAKASGLVFNVSHTPGLIALAVARDVRIGIDVEHANVHGGLAALADDVLSPDELSVFLSQPFAAREQAFLRHWTLKESYVKARGEGLSHPLPAFSVGHVIPCRQQMHAAVADADGRWLFAQYRIAQSHFLSLCFSDSEDSVTQLFFRKTVPLQADESFQPEILGCLFPHAQEGGLMDIYVR